MGVYLGISQKDVKVPPSFLRDKEKFWKNVVERTPFSDTPEGQPSPEPELLEPTNSKPKGKKKKKSKSITINKQNIRDTVECKAWEYYMGHGEQCVSLSSDTLKHILTPMTLLVYWHEIVPELFFNLFILHA